MTSFKAIHFPETTLDAEEILGQLLLLDSITYLLPTPTAAAENSLCPTYEPKPLGDDATRFQQLLDELKGNEAAFYQGQMSKLALEHFESRDGDTVRDIIKSMHGTADSSKPSKDDEEIWQARLLLKLAEIMREEEREVQSSLNKIKESQAEMLGELKGEEECQDLFNALNGSQSNQLPVRVESLIKAWGRLLLAGDKTFNILHCHNQTTAEPFLEADEAKTGKRPKRIVRLPIPKCTSDNYSDNRDKWLSNNSWLADLKTALLDTVQSGSDSLTTKLMELSAKWSAAVDKEDIWEVPEPTKDYGPPAIEIYLLETPVKELLSSMCNVQNEDKTSGNALIVFTSKRSTKCN